MQKALFIICDGLPDRPLPQLNNKTPLEVAKTPNLDKIAVDGISGMMYTVGVGVRPGSDTAHLSLFGYDPYVYYSGRGPFECAGIGMDLQPGDVAFRANAGTVDENLIVTDRRAGRIMSTQELVEYLGTIEIDGVQFILQSSLGHRIGMIMRGKDLSYRVSDQDPHKTGVKILDVKPLDDSPKSARTAELLNKFTEEVAKRLADAPFNKARVADNQLPANIILFRGAGCIPDQLVKFPDKYKLKTAFVGGAPMYKGIAKILGMDVIAFNDDEGVTGLYSSNLVRKIDKAILATQDHDLVFVHIKAADTLAEDGNYQGKIEFIEKIDHALQPLAERNDFITVITADHTTSSQLKQHTADPVPITIKGEGVRTDDLAAYTERECAKGRLGVIQGVNLMPILIDLMGLAELYGA